MSEQPRRGSLWHSFIWADFIVKELAFLKATTRRDHGIKGQSIKKSVLSPARS